MDGAQEIERTRDEQDQGTVDGVSANLDNLYLPITPDLEMAGGHLKANLLLLLVLDTHLEGERECAHEALELARRLTAPNKHVVQQRQPLRR